MHPLRVLPILFVLFVATARGVITISGVTDKTKPSNPVAFTVTADPAAATTTATLDGVPVPIGTSVSVTAVRYHELKAESRTAGGVLVDSRLVRFIVSDPSRNGSEDGIPPHTPFRSVNDAPSAFAGGVLKVIAPASWPSGLPIPIAAVLRDGANEGLRLNGVVTFGGFPLTTLQLRRGWGSVAAPGASAAGLLHVDAEVNGLTHNPGIIIETAPAFTNVSGVIAGNTAWPPNSRMRVSGTLTINAGATLTIGAGTIVTVAPATEIVVNGTLQVNGVDGNSVVFAPDAPGTFWGGIELPATTSVVNAAHTIFTGAGEDLTWFDTHSGYASHRPEQALFLVAGSGSGTAVGAQLHLADCYAFNLRGQQMNSRVRTWVDLQRTLMQRCITCGELNGSRVTIDRSALIEFPSETGNFVDADNDAIYLTNGDLSITNTVIGFTKDDGIDSGGDGGDNPFTAAADITPQTIANNWFEGTYHEGNSLSGSREVSYTDCVFFNCGQGVEAGYSAGSGNGPNATVDGCLFAANMVGVRWGDNYGSGYSYNQTMEVKNSIVLHSLFRDAFSGQWHPTQANAWIYQDATASNTFGRPYFNVHDNHLSQPDALHHPANAAWNPLAHASLLAPFMPVPGSNVGVAISSYAPAQSDPSAYPGVFAVRLSTFSSLPVTVNWAIIGKVDPFDSAETSLASGTLAFAPGETLKTITAPVANATNYGLIRVALLDPVNAEVTGEGWYFKTLTPSPSLIALGSSGWRYRETRSEPPAAWRQLGFDDSSAAATEWLPATLPAGFGVGGVTFGTTVTAGSSSDRTRAFYFRKKFTVENPAQITALTFRIRRDDGAVVWLNNDPTPTVVSADGTFNPPYTYAMTGTANAVPNSTNTGNFLEFSIPASKLVAGLNILAIEMHQATLTSSDLILDCELLAQYAGTFALNLAKTAGEGVLYWFDPAALLEETTDFTSWSPLPGLASPVPISVSGPQRFYRLRK